MTVMALESARDGAADEEERLRALADLGVSGTVREELTDDVAGVMIRRCT